jgi:Flp pilus assembly protein TadG
LENQALERHVLKTVRNESGAVLIEFVIILIPLLVLLFGSIEFGVAAYNKAMITNASREGARAGIVFNAGSRLTDGEIRQIAQDYCTDHLITFGPTTAPAVSVTREGNDPGDDLTVSVTYAYGFLVIQNLIPGFNPTLNLFAQSVMRME